MPIHRIALLATLLAQTATAQVLQPRQPKTSDLWTFGLSAFGGIPVGDFKNHEDGGGGGLLDIGFQPFRGEPLVLRFSGGHLIYGHYNRDRDREVCDFFGNNCTNETVFFNSRNHTMTFLQLGPEIVATSGSWRPFVHALAGYTFFNSWSKYGSGGFSGEPDSRGLWSSDNFSTGYGIGVRKVGTGDGRPLGWELSFRFTRNAKATYLNDEGVYRNSDGTYDVRPHHGAANVLGVHFGFWVGPHRNWNGR